MIPTRTKALYGLPAFAVAFATIGVMNFSLGYYTTDLGVPLGLVTLLFVGSRAIDLFTDPLVGSLSDRTRGRFGRRKPWIAAGVPVLAIGGYMLFAPPPDAGAVHYVVWVSVLFLGFTLVQLPFVAWGAELSPDYDEKTRIAGWREGFTVLGNIVALGLFGVIQAGGDGSLGPALRVLGLVLVVTAPALFAVTLLTVREAPIREGEASLGFAEGLRAVAANPYFRRYALGLFLLFVGVMPGAAMGYYVFDHLVGRPELYGYYSLTGFASMLVGLPFWVWFAGRIQKHRAVAIGLGYLAVLAGLIPFWLMLDVPPGTDAAFMLAYGTVQGLGFAAVFVLPYTLLADVIESDTAETGQQRAALYSAFAGMILKLALTIGLFVTLSIPSLAGFEPSVRPNADAALLAVAGTFGWGAAALWIAGVPVFWGYGLTRAEQERIVGRVAHRAAGPVAGDPLPADVGPAGVGPAGVGPAGQTV